MLKYLKFAIREFLGIENDYESLLSSQDQILEKLQQIENLELKNQELILEGEKKNYYDYLTVKNALWVLLFLGFIGGGFWLYNSDLFNTSVLESIKSLGTLSKNLHTIDHQSVLDALKKLNENSVNLSKEEIKILMEIKNLLLAKGIDENKSPILDKPISEMRGTFVLGNPIPGIDD